MAKADQNVDIGEILTIEAARVNEIINACYKRMDELKLESSDQPAGEIIRFMVDLGKTEHERFFAGFILGRIYEMNMAGIQAHSGMGGMFS